MTGRTLPLNAAVATLLAAGALAVPASADAARLAGCPLLPKTFPTNQRVDNLPVRADSAAITASIGLDEGLHADFGSGRYEGRPIGIPYTVVGGAQPDVRVDFGWDDESDAGPYPIPPDAKIEGGPDSDGDRHVLVVDRDACRLYETFDSHPNGDGSWSAGSGAIYDLRSNRLRPAGWTSADAAGLPILAGLVRYDEVAAGKIDHAIRVTVPESQKAYLWPARHQAGSSTDPDLPPMGLRLRLKASFDISGFDRDARVILKAAKTYGLIVADNGSPWYMSGVPDERWDNDALHSLGDVPGSAFQAVDASALMVNPNSGATG